MKHTLKTKGKSLKLTTLGFTLIELLAVIVILAIIALIATPIVLNIIDETKDSATLRSAEFYLDAVENSIATSILNGVYIPNGTYKITGEGNICLEYESDNKTCKKPLEVKVSGETPTNGTINITNGNIGNIVLVHGDNTIVKDEKGALVKSVSFEKDDWDIIVANIKAGNLNAYNVGDTKEVSLTGFTNTENEIGTYTVRIVNNSTPVECNAEGFSQTACGFVIEFVDVITTHVMNPVTVENQYGTNLGGWRDSEMRTYLNPKESLLNSGVIYNALPKELKDNIIETKVVSGHGNTSTDNFITMDKLYLLSTTEVWGQATTIKFDSASELTRQLDYYEIQGVTVKKYSFAAKNDNNGKRSYWWLRSAASDSNSNFYCANYGGGPLNGGAASNLGISPAFRIG